MPIPPTSTLQAIQTKVRRLTRKPSTAQISDTDLQNYINTFVVYDFPEQLRTFNLRKTFTFFTNPLQDVYITDSTLPQINPLYNFQNIYLTVHPPVYIAGYQSFYTQSREQFFNIYPNINSIASIGIYGDGITETFTGVINANMAIIPVGFHQHTAVLQNQVLFDSRNSVGAGLALIDVPVIDPATGNPTLNGNLYIPGQTPATPPTVVLPFNTINYATGVFTITFPSAPAAGAHINSQTVIVTPSLPQSILFFDEKFVVRPVPDQVYRINMEVYVRPSALLATNQSPQLEEWWQYIAYGAAKKIFEDQMDLDSVQQIMPEFKVQERLCLRRTLVQLTNERVATIFTEQTSLGGGFGWGPGGAGNF